MKLKELLGEAFPIIAKFAPTIAGALGGQMGFAAGYIIPILANAFDAHPTDLKSLISNIVNDPNTQTKLQNIEDEHCDWLCTTLDSIGNLSEAEINIKLKWQTDNKVQSA